jgi:hypothetical protein
MLDGVVYAEEMRLVRREVHLLVLGEEMVKGRGGTFHGPPMMKSGRRSVF